ncbi:MAG TPA: FAD-binding oxidoreductase [Microvirga sp.]|nr:FAD-binding oxidoreductase [Microvirga sp.]
MRITIIGAGIVGSAAAHRLLDAGHEVTLLDTEGKTGRPSDGNAGWIAHTDIMPLASPKVWRNLPRWMLDPLGPLTIRPGYLPQLAPWLLRFVLASSPGRIDASMRAIRSINAQALPCWKALLDTLDLKDVLRERGLLSVWRSPSAFEQAKGLIERQRELGIRADVLDAGDLKRMEPALHGVASAVLYADGCHVADPAALTAAIFTSAVVRGAVHVREHAVAIEPGGDGIRVLTDGDSRSLFSDQVVVAAGAWSRMLARQAGDDIPLDTERGYNATFPPGTFGIGRPIMFEGEGFVATPLDTGDRVGGAVEFAGLKAAPNHRRTDAMVQRLKRFLPHLNGDGPARRWMGFRPSLPDSLPVIGHASRDNRIVYAFGHAHHGLTQAAVTAQMVGELIDGRPSGVDLKPFSPARFR